MIIAITFQILFLIQTLYNIKSLQKLPKAQTIPFISIQLVGLFLNITHFFKWYAIPHYMPQSVFNDETTCGFMAYSILLIPFIFHSLELSILTDRLDGIFKGTPIEWKAKTKWICLSIINCIISVVFILWMIYLLPPCIRVWQPHDYKNGDEFLFYCNIFYSRDKITRYSGYIGIGFVVVANLFLGLYVTYKLKSIYHVFALQLQETTSYSRGNRMGVDNIDDNRVYVIMKKNTILTISICFFTIFSYSMEFWADGDWEFLLFFDYFLIPLFIGLMFKYNERLYSIIFCCCNRNKWKSRYEVTNIEMAVQNGSLEIEQKEPIQT